MAAKAQTTKKTRAKAPAPSPAPTPAPPPPIGDNSRPLTEDERDDLFIVHLAQSRQDNKALEVAMDVVRGVRKQRNRNRNVCATDGFPLTELDRILEDEGRPRHEIEAHEAMRSRMRRAANQPGGAPIQLDLVEKLEKDEAYYRGVGYTAGMRGDDNDVMLRDVPQEFQQKALEGWHDGQARLAKAWTTKNRIEGKEDPTPPAAEGGDGEGDEEQNAESPKKPDGDDAGGAEVEAPVGEPVTEPA